MKPIADWRQIELRSPCAYFRRDCELPGGPEFARQILELSELLVVPRRQADPRLQSLLPPSMEKEPFLGGEAEVALIPNAVLENAKLFEQLADQCRPFVRDRDLIGGPRVGGDVVLAP